MKLEPMRVVGPGGQRMEVQPGDDWPLPYRGSHYSVRNHDGHLRVTWSHRYKLLPADGFPRDLIQAVRAQKQGNGSFRITSHGAVVTKVQGASPDDWQPKYVGRYEDDLRFAGVDSNPTHLRPGMYWTGFPDSNGEPWSVSPGVSARNHLHWKFLGVRLTSTDPYERLTSRYLDIRALGGRAYINEYGHIWMNLQDHELNPQHREEFQARQQEHVDQMKADENDILIRLLVGRIRRTFCRPIYLGHISDFDNGEPPWTYYSDGAYSFGRGPDGVGDDDELED